DRLDLVEIQLRERARQDAFLECLFGRDESLQLLCRNKRMPKCTAWLQEAALYSAPYRYGRDADYGGGFVNLVRQPEPYFICLQSEGSFFGQFASSVRPSIRSVALH
ncbi:MAG TPA: hypothetical protein PLS03_11090, partial [Terrimicrobiaceae bacterium]|nr:hypothetical protein [Terrimicrobiaceae bacterium]